MVMTPRERSEILGALYTTLPRQGARWDMYSQETGLAQQPKADHDGGW